MSYDMDEIYCQDCGNIADGEICERCRHKPLDNMKTDRRWNGKTFWQEPEAITHFTISDEPVMSPADLELAIRTAGKVLGKQNA